MKLDWSPKVHHWLTEPLSAEVFQSIARLANADDVQHVAVMPDVHLAREACVGLAVATTTLVYPQAVGSDLGCGMAAIRLTSSADVLDSERMADQVLAGLYSRVPSLRHSKATQPEALPAALQATPLSHTRLEKLKTRDGRMQFGTLGRGNHFLELQADVEGRLWLMVHSGSRGIGQAISSHHLTLAKSHRPGQRLLALDAGSEDGRAFLADLDWAVRYAEASRLEMIRVVAGLLNELCGADLVPETLIHANHNHVRRESLLGSEFWVHRKGALSAGSDEAGIIPGSMGTVSYHVSGRGHELALRSSSHGAGRAKSRAEACKSISRHQLLREMEDVWFDHRHADHLCDEAPSAYKDVRAVMRAQRELTRIVREVQPLLSFKGT